MAAKSPAGLAEIENLLNERKDELASIGQNLLVGKRDAALSGLAGVVATILSGIPAVGKLASMAMARTLVAPANEILEKQIAGWRVEEDQQALAGKAAAAVREVLIETLETFLAEREEAASVRVEALVSDAVLQLRNGQQEILAGLDRFLARPAEAPDATAAFFEGPGAGPAVPIPEFSGRDREMEELAAALTSADQNAACVVVCGTGGIGKTALVQHFVATRAQSIFPFGCVWLDGKALVPELARAARRFGWPRDIDPSPEQANAFLRNQLHHSLVLLVVDNLPESPNLACLPFPGGACRTLVTSRAVNLAHDLAVPTETLHLENWEPLTCRTYLRLVVPRLSTEPDADLDALSIFVHGLPLAIRLIARAFARHRDRTAKAHLARLEAEPLGTLDCQAGPADRSIAATFLEAFGGLGNEERKVLLALAACAQGTRADIVAAVAGVRDDAASNALNALADVSLAEYRDGTEAPWGIHDVVRLFVSAQEGSEDALAAHLSWAGEHLKRHNNPTDYQAMDLGVGEIVAGTERLLRTGKVERAAELTFPLGQHLLRRGQYVLALGLFERLLEHVIPDSAMDAACSGNLGVLYRTLGNMPKAIAFHERSLTIEEKIGLLGGQALQLGNLGGCYLILRDIPKAIQFLKRSLVIDQKLGLLESQATSLDNLGLCYRRLGDVPKAIGFHARALVIDEKVGQLEGQARALGNLGICFQGLGDITRAIEFMQRSLAINNQIGRLEGQAAQLGNLGTCYQLLGDVPKAIEFHEQALAIDETLNGRASHLGNLGRCYQHLGDVPKAIDSFERCLALLEAMGLPDSHPNVSMARKSLEALRVTSEISC